MPTDEHDAIPFGADTASMTGSTASSMFGGRDDERLDEVRKQRTDINNFIGDWVIQHARVRNLDYESLTPEGLNNLMLVEECDERHSTLVMETI